MIKRIRLVDHVEADGGPAVGLVTPGLAAPPGARPVRAALCTALPDIAPGPRFDAIGIEWFTDGAHLARFEAWLASPGGAAAIATAVGAAGGPAGRLVVAEEHPMRGADWLERRWREGGTKLKHMAIARRASGLTPAEFSRLWQSRAGKVGAVRIPDEARGLAYVQNHPLPGAGADWPYDAVNEVYFDDADGLRARIDWFAENFEGAGNEDDLVSESWFVAVREEILGAE